MQKQDRPVAFFDSGLGGISVLRETVRLLPQENYLYYGDSLHAPYGVKSEAQIQALSLAAAEHLVNVNGTAVHGNLLAPPEGGASLLLCLIDDYTPSKPAPQGDGTLSESPA